MGYDLDPVLTEADRKGFDYKVLDIQKTRSNWQLIASKFARSGRYQFQFWDEVEWAESFQTEDGWSLVAQLITHLHEVHLYFDLDDEKAGVVFALGSELAAALAEVGSRDFYVTGEAFDFLLTYTDHDCVLAAGKAKEWLLFNSRNALRPR